MPFSLLKLHATSWGLALAVAVAAPTGLFPSPVAALSTDPVSSAPAEVRMVTVENAIGPDTQSISAALHVDLADGWKTYWRNPGEVGLPPEIGLTSSDNVASAEVLWPAPERFTAFGIENFGYSGEVAYPLRITLEEPGMPAVLRADVSLLLCSDICVPADYQFELVIPGATEPSVEIDLASADLVSRFADRVPVEVESAFLRAVVAHVDRDRQVLSVEARADTPFAAPDVFPEMGPSVAFGPPDIRLGDGDRTLWAEFPILSDDMPDAAPTVTVTDGGLAATLPATLTDAAPAPPFLLDRAAPGIARLLSIALIAFLGGMILNVMPCVLPVLSLKLSAVLSSREANPTRVRGGFLASAAGVLAFMWVLAALIFTLQRVGVTVGWGLQFQNPTFLAAMIAILLVFTANLFGLFEINLPSSVQTWMARRGASGGYSGDFATGALAAVLATPCSAPLLGTAIAFALTGGAIEIGIVFTAMGLGLALPYFVIAAFPALVNRLPKPGAWMNVVKLVLAGLLALTAAWLIWVMMRVAGNTPTLAALGLGVAIVATLSIRRSAPVAKLSAVVAFAIGILVVPGFLDADRNPAVQTVAGAEWVPFDRSEIARIVSRGGVVFVDVTADWCLTCQANKVLVLDREPVVTALLNDGVTTMRADWTRPDDAISRYLAAFDRYGIPFNAVYGPNAPGGIVLPELLTPTLVLEALGEAAADDLAQAQN